MAQSSEEKYRVATEVDADTELGEAWSQWVEGFEHRSEATRSALRDALLDDDETASTWSDSGPMLVVAALMAAAIASLVGQTFRVFGPIWGLALGGFAVLLVGTISVWGL